MSAKVVTGKVRISYPNIFAPRAFNEGDKAKYSAQLIIPKSDKKTLKKLRDAEEAAKQAGIERFGAAWAKKGVRSVLHDGDEDADERPELADSYYLSVSSPRKPFVVDRARELILDPDEIYGGCYVFAALGAYPYDMMGNRGVSFGLDGIQKVADGEPFDGRSRAEDVFGVLDDDDDDEDFGI